ncbi:hypothetical protein IHQ71_04385 [Rhizobium sp. TH2]|uniref:hypothetical protein n=1 Tax=Rhizobium sp. TH2 TaxID=2775403 RepID=UPI0021581BC8|nr:hypothetical protein [Rhizobium sp. TH2]UVC09858.1 hypothetical protein IHQ71_04385 [Rhizobium sp. TH2]
MDFASHLNTLPLDRIDIYAWPEDDGSMEFWVFHCGRNLLDMTYQGPSYVDALIEAIRLKHRYELPIYDFGGAIESDFTTCHLHLDRWALQ